MKPATISLLCFLVIISISVPKKWALLSLIITTTLVPYDQRIIVVGLDFTVLRIIVLISLVRLFFSSDTKTLVWNDFDRLIVLWSLTGSLVYIIQWREIGSVIYKSGVMFDCLGMYLIFRHNIKSWQDIERVIKLFAIMSFFSAIIIGLEAFLHKSMYSIFGERTGTAFHRGRYRCSGAFPHSLMMGAYWANLLPFFYSMVKANISKRFYLIAFFATLICVILSGSSTPIMSVATIILFWFLYSHRFLGKKILYYSIGIVFVLQLIMNAPVWHLMSRVGVFGGSTGWHRFKIFDEFMKHIPNWIILGCKNPRSWSSYPQMGDITNQFMLEGIRGGLITLILFILIMYKTVSIPCRMSIKLKNSNNHWLCWGVCVAMLGHIVTFWGVSYFGQIIMLLYLMMAIVSFIYDEELKLKSETLMNA